MGATESMIGFTATEETYRQVACVAEYRGMGFTQKPLGEVREPQGQHAVYCLSIQTATPLRDCTMNTRGRFGRPGLHAPLSVRGTA